MNRGRETELLVAGLLKRLWPKARAVNSSARGRDILNTKPFAIEVKARAAFNPLEWIRQAIRNAHDDIPVVIMRPNGFGKERIGEWLVFMRLDDWMGVIDYARLGETVNRTAPNPVEKYLGASRRERLEPQSDNSGGQDVTESLSSILHSMGLRHGEWEILIRPSQSIKNSTCDSCQREIEITRRVSATHS